MMQGACIECGTRQASLYGICSHCAGIIERMRVPMMRGSASHHLMSLHTIHVELPAMGLTVQQAVENLTNGQCSLDREWRGW